jgi:hypothetical protein
MRATKGLDDASSSRSSVSLPSRVSTFQELPDNPPAWPLAGDGSQRSMRRVKATMSFLARSLSRGELGLQRGEILHEPDRLPAIGFADDGAKRLTVRLRLGDIANDRHLKVVVDQLL